MRDRHQRLLKLLDRDPKLAGHLLIRGRPLQAMLKLYVGALDLPRPRAHRPRHPIKASQLIDDRPPNPRNRIGLKLDLALGLKALDRRNQPPQPIRDQIRLLHMRRQPRPHPPRHILHKRRIGHHQTLPRTPITPHPKPTPQITQLDGLDVRLHSATSLTSCVKPADGYGHRPTAGARTPPECKPASWTARRVPASPGWPAGQPHPRAGAW